MRALRPFVLLLRLVRSVVCRSHLTRATEDSGHSIALIIGYEGRLLNFFLTITRVLDTLVAVCGGEVIRYYRVVTFVLLSRCFIALATVTLFARHGLHGGGQSDRVFSDFLVVVVSWDRGNSRVLTYSNVGVVGGLRFVLWYTGVGMVLRLR